MPILIATVILSLLAGLLLRDRSVSIAIASILGLLSVVVFVWTVADGKGNDPWWLIPIAIAGAALAVAAAIGGHNLRANRTLKPAHTPR